MSKKNQTSSKTKSKYKTTLTKEEIKTIKKRMSELKDDKKDSVQKAIPFEDMFPDGICMVTKNYFTKTIQFFDINYKLATLDEKNNIFSKYCELLNYFDESVKFQLTFENQNSNIEQKLSELEIEEQEDNFNEIRKEYSEMLKNQLIQGSSGKVLKKFFTFGINAKNYKEARIKLNNISDEIMSMLKAIGVTGKVLDGKERLEMLYKELNPLSTEPFIFDWSYRAKTGASVKDFIAPNYMNFKFKKSFEIGNAKGAVYSINLLASELSDEILKDYLTVEDLNSISLHVQPYDQVSALKFIKLKLTDVEQMKIDEQKKAIKAGYDPDILPPSIKMYIEEFEKVLEDLNSRNERLFVITLTLRCYGKSKKDLNKTLDYLNRITQKNGCKLIPLEYQQQQGFNTSLPIGLKCVNIKRTLTTSAVAAFVPFSSVELFQGNKATYYGLNTLSKNLIMADRKLLKNPNGLFLGTPGSGKSFSVKREILDVFLKTSDDIIICDPEGEYYPLVQALNGERIRIASNSEQFINPMDVTIDDYLFKNPLDVIADKSNFIITLCELIINGQYGISAEERSVIDACVKNIYLRFINNNPSKETMPMLSDLQEELKQQGDIAIRIYNSLEMFVSGSQNLFNHRTNIDMTNRIICFDVKELGNQLKKIGMLIVQDTVWNRVSLNRNLKKSTRYYIDEFHLLLKEEQTAKYSVEIWKRFRKWGGIPTGITQNIKDLLSSQEIENIFDNSDFVYMLNQAAGDREILADKLHISEQQLKYVTNSGQGQGLLFFGDVILPFKDPFPKNTTMYKLMTTNPNDK